MEDYNWNEETENEFIKYPLKYWFAIIFDIVNYSKNYIKIEVNLYKNTCNKILKYDVFIGEKFIDYVILTVDKNIQNFLENDFSTILKNNKLENKNNIINTNFLVF